MKDIDIPFDPEQLVRAVEDVRDHLTSEKKLTMRTTEFALPDPAPELSPEEILDTRQSLNLSQPVFARLLNVPTGTAVSWEKGRRKPSGAALRLLQIARNRPDLLLDLETSSET